MTLKTKEIVLASCLVGIVLGSGVVYLRHQTGTPSQLVAVPVVAPYGGQSMLPTETISIGDTKLTVEVATTSQEHQDGLSNRSSLSDGTGMLFIFDPPSAEGFWMKDMLFSLDIVWADANGTITTIDQGLSPETYPNVYRPSRPAKYVLEVPAGYAAKKGIAVGQKIVVQ